MANKPFKKLRFSLTGDTYSPVDEEARQNIGDLSQLDTTHKDNLVEAINEAAQSGGGGTGVPSGGSKGQVLTKRSSVEGDAGWEYPPVMYASGNDPSNLSVTWNENYTVMDFFMRQSIVQAEYEDSLVVHLKLIKAYITAVPPNFTSVYHFFFGAVTEIANGTATFGTLEVTCDNASAHTGVGVYTEVEVGVSDEAVQDAVDEYLTEHPAMTGMFTNAAKSALIALLEKVAYIDGNGRQYLDELITNLAATVTSISAVFTQGNNTIYWWDNLDYLKQFLVVTASYSDGTSAIITNYTLSGSLISPNSTITVTHENKQTTFTVNVNDGASYSYTGELAKVSANGVDNNPENTVLVISVYSPLRRRAFVLNRGSKSYKTGAKGITTPGNYGEFSPDSNWYPIPVPPSANSISFSITPSTQYSYITLYRKVSGGYTRLQNSGWVRGSGSVDISEHAGSDLFITCNCKENSAGTSEFSVEPTAYTLTFS